MKKDNGFSVLIIILIVAAVAVGAYFLGNSGLLNKYFPNPLNPTPSPVSYYTPVPSMSPTQSSSPSASPASNWKTYKNDKYGFEISFPDTYKALTSKEDLYGWPNAVVLIYNGGQSYDLPIEVWTNQADYLAKYQNYIPDKIQVRQSGNVYITLQNMNSDPEVNQIISTFKLIDSSGQ